MTTRVIRSADEVPALGKFILARGKFPVTVTIANGASRSSQANRLSQRWYSDISRQLGDQTHEEVRAYCKLHFGVPIMRAGNEAFRKSYDATMKPIEYETKLEAMRVLDIPVTRLMTPRQMSAYMDEMQRYWLGNGFRLTDPEAMKYEEELK